MDLDQLRHAMATTGHVRIRRHLGRCLVWVLGYAAIAAIGLACVVGGFATSSGGGTVALVVVGVVIALPGLAGVLQLAPGLVGRGAVRVDGDGVGIGRRFAPWSQVEEVQTRLVITRGVTQTLVVLVGAERRTPFHAPGRRAPWWPWGGKVLPRGLVVRQPDLFTFLHEQHATARTGSRPLIAPPLFD